MQVEEIFIWGKKRKKNQRISLLDEYYYQSPSSVANQNAGFALVRLLGDTKQSYVRPQGAEWIRPDIHFLGPRLNIQCI